MVGKEFAQAAVNNYEGGIDALLEIVPVDRVYDQLIHRPGIELPSLTNFMVWLENNKERFVVWRDMFTNRRPDKKDDPIDELVGRVKALTDKRAETYCFTGSGPISRRELMEHAYNCGQQTTDNANLCTVLVAADPNGNSAKLKKARAKGIKVISYEQFMKEIGI
jgi:NAD-dependent DNA ligase